MVARTRLNVTFYVHCLSCVWILSSYWSGPRVLDVFEHQFSKSGLIDWLIDWFIIQKQQIAIIFETEVSSNCCLKSHGLWRTYCHFSLYVFTVLYTTLSIRLCIKHETYFTKTCFEYYHNFYSINTRKQFSCVVTRARVWAAKTDWQNQPLHDRIFICPLLRVRNVNRNICLVLLL